MLETVQKESLEMFQQISSRDGIDRSFLAGPFVATTRRDFVSGEVPTVLYIGKATAGDFGRTAFLKTPTLKGRHKYGADFLHEEVVPGRYRSAFWNFAMEVGAIAASHCGRKVEPLQNVIWSNLAKLGVRRGNPSPAHLGFQRDLCLRMLRAEISHYSPTVIFLVTNDYWGDLVREFFHDRRDLSWQKGFEDAGVWWRPAMEGLPPVVWTAHPQGKPKAHRQQWLACLKRAQQA